MSKSILTNIADNKDLFNAVKETVLKHFEETPYAEGASDELLGQITRARISGRKRVEIAFTEIQSHQSTAPLTEKENPAY